MIALYAHDEADAIAKLKMVDLTVVTITPDRETRGLWLWLRGSPLATAKALRTGVNQRPRWTIHQ